MSLKSISRGPFVASACAFVFALGFDCQAKACENIQPHLGWIIANPTTTMLFWPPGRPDGFGLWLHFGAILADPQFYVPVAEYGVHAGRVGSGFPLTNVGTGTNVTDDTITNAIFRGLVTANRVPATDETFLVYMPQSVRAAADVAPGGLGHHSFKNLVFPDGRTHPVIFAVAEYAADASSIDIIASHEVYEMYTDPIFAPSGQGCGWWDESKSTLAAHGVELVDLCIQYFQGIPIVGGVPFRDSVRATVYSKSACTCL